MSPPLAHALLILADILIVLGGLFSIIVILGLAIRMVFDPKK